MKWAVFNKNGAKRLAVAPKHSDQVFVDSEFLGEALKHLERSAGVSPADASSTPLHDVMEVIAWTSGPNQLDQSITRLANDPEIHLRLEDLKLEPPIARPGKIVCLAGNYREHIIESGYVPPRDSEVITQQLFLKPSSALIGNDDEIVIGKNNVTVGWETELAVVMGKRGRNIEAGKALDFVFGYTILNDVSERRLNSRIDNRTRREMDGFLDWLAGKWFDGFAPCGPWIVTTDEIADPHNLEIELLVNGEVRQHGNTRDMIFSIPEQIAYISSIMTLEPGDIISTGTPVGAGVGGRASLQDGDELVCEIENIGKLRNRVRSEN